MNIILKDESSNSFGTWKDRRSKHIVAKAITEGIYKLCLITSGNAGYSLAKIAIPRGIKVISVIDKNTKEFIKNTLKEVCSKVIEVDLSEKIFKPEEVISLARENDTESIWDVTNGWSEAYESIVNELKNENFDYIVCSVGSGEAFVGLSEGLKKNKLNAKLIGVGVLENPSFADKLATPWTPYKSKVERIVEEGHTLILLTEDEVKEAWEKYKNQCKSEPSSTVVWKGLEKANLDPNSKVVVINSGSGLF